MPLGPGDGRRGGVDGGQGLAVVRAVGRLLVEGAASRRRQIVRRLQPRFQQGSGGFRRGGARASHAGVRQQWGVVDGGALPARGPPGQGGIIRAVPPLALQLIGTLVDRQKVNQKGTVRGEGVSEAAGAEHRTRRPQPK